MVLLPKYRKRDPSRYGVRSKSLKKIQVSHSKKKRSQVSWDAFYKGNEYVDESFLLKNLNIVIQSHKRVKREGQLKQGCLNLNICE